MTTLADVSAVSGAGPDVPNVPYSTGSTSHSPVATGLSANDREAVVPMVEARSGSPPTGWESNRSVVGRRRGGRARCHVGGVRDGLAPRMDQLGTELVAGVLDRDRRVQLRLSNGHIELVEELLPADQRASVAAGHRPRHVLLPGGITLRSVTGTVVEVLDSPRTGRDRTTIVVSFGLKHSGPRRSACVAQHIDQLLFHVWRCTSIFLPNV